MAFLLPVAAAYGWYAAKRHYTREYLHTHIHPLTRAYCRGLNYLLSEKPDQAIQVFADILQQDDETIETHIALGNLFRRRGEVEKAIEVHEHLLNRQGLSEEQRAQAYFELGMDFMRAGLFDRAETIFRRLSRTEIHAIASLQQLLQLYQQEKEWGKAIECTQALEHLGKAPPRGEHAAQFLCELAEEAVAGHRFDEARQQLAEALRLDPQCVRASLIDARIALIEKRYDCAVQTLKKVETQQPEYLPEILGPLENAFRELGRSEEFIGYLGYLYERHGLVAAAVQFAEHVGQQGGRDLAVEYLLKILDQKPDLRALSHAISLLGEARRHDESSLNRVGCIMARLAKECPVYRCSQCGFTGSELHWRCPSCQVWGSTAPV